MNKLVWGSVFLHASLRKITLLSVVCTFPSQTFCTTDGVKLPDFISALPMYLTSMCFLFVSTPASVQLRAKVEVTGRSRNAGIDNDAFTQNLFRIDVCVQKGLGIFPPTV